MNASKLMRFAILGATLTLVLAACGAADDTSGGTTAAGGSAVPASGITIAMITHETPGDTYWDIIKAGANQACFATRHRLEVLERSRLHEAGDAGPERHRLGGGRNRHDRGRARRLDRRGRSRQGRQHPGCDVRLRHRRLPEAWCRHVLRVGRVRRRPSPWRPDRRVGWHQHPLCHPPGGFGGPRGAVQGCWREA